MIIYQENIFKAHEAFFPLYSAVAIIIYALLSSLSLFLLLLNKQLYYLKLSHVVTEIYQSSCLEFTWILVEAIWDELEMCSKPSMISPFDSSSPCS